MRTIVIVPLLLLAFILAEKSAHAENILYCQSELNTGFVKKDGRWVISKFQPQRWTIKFNDDFSAVEGLREDSSITLDCKNSVLPDREMGKGGIVCRLSWEDQGIWSADQFLFNKETMRFVYSQANSFAYVANKEGLSDTDTFHAGTCEQF